MTETELQVQVADYLRLQYPDVLFHSDFGSGVKLTPGQAMKQKRQNGGRRAWPDMFIAQSDVNWEHADEYTEIRELGDWHMGLFIELKKEGTRLKKKNGGWATPHIEEQARILEKLEDEGYKAVFACGFDEAKKTIDKYLGGTEK